MTARGIVSLAVSDPKLDPYRSLRQPRDSTQFVVEGKLLVERLAASPLTISSVVIDRDRRQLLPPLPETVPIWGLDVDAMRSLVGFDFHRGILALAERPASPPPLEPFTGNAVVVAIDRVDDPENLGVILRTCGAFGVSEVVTTPGTVDPWSRRVVRVSMGAVFRLRLRVADLVGEFERWRAAGVESLATCLAPDSAPIAEWSPNGPHAWIFGREDHGIDPRWIASADRRITIPIDSGVDSLNVAQSAAICLHLSSTWRRRT
ncbi:MAG: RNA methyltransferase [Planctomycetota bacterium]